MTTHRFGQRLGDIHRIPENGQPVFLLSASERQRLWHLAWVGRTHFVFYRTFTFSFTCLFFCAAHQHHSVGEVFCLLHGRVTVFDLRGACHRGSGYDCAFSAACFHLDDLFCHIIFHCDYWHSIARTSIGFCYTFYAIIIIIIIITIFVSGSSSSSNSSRSGSGIAKIGLCRACNVQRDAVMLVEQGTGMARAWLQGRRAVRLNRIPLLFASEDGSSLIVWQCFKESNVRF